MINIHSGQAPRSFDHLLKLFSLYRYLAIYLKTWITEKEEKIVNSVLNFRRGTHFWLCLLETQVFGDRDQHGWTPVQYE